jgi:hypothetical protein
MIWDSVLATSDAFSYLPDHFRSYLKVIAATNRLKIQVAETENWWFISNSSHKKSPGPGKPGLI